MDYRYIFQSAEEVPKASGKLTNRVPEWLRGTILSVTPGKWDFEDFTVNHYFDGFALLMRFAIGEETVTVQTKFLESDAYKKAVLAGKTVLTEYGTPSSKDPTKNIVTRLTSFIPELSDNGNNQIYMFGKEIFCSNGNRFAWQIDPKTLESLRKLDSRKYFGMRTMNCPPLKEDDGSLTCVCTNITIKGYTGYGVFRIPPPRSPGDFSAVCQALVDHEVLTIMPTTKPSILPYLRLFSTTKNYIIICEQPYGVNVRSMLANIFQGQYFCYQQNMEYDSTFKNRFIIIDKSTGKMLPQYFESSECFHYFHIGNSYETDDGDWIVMDFNQYPNSDILIHGFGLENRRNGPNSIHSVIKRFRLPLRRKDAKITLTPELLDAQGCMFPTINKERRGKSYRFLYGTSELNQNDYRNALIKLDVDTKEVTKWTGEDYEIPYGPIFIPKPHGVAEDDGVLLALVSDGRTGGHTSMVILCAQKMSEISRVTFPCFLPITTSLLFIPPTTTTTTK